MNMKLTDGKVSVSGWNFDVKIPDSIISDAVTEALKATLADDPPFAMVHTNDSGSFELFVLLPFAEAFKDSYPEYSISISELFEDAIHECPEEGAALELALKNLAARMNQEE